MEQHKNSNGEVIEYRKVGDGDRVILFLHGWMVSGKVWDWVHETLAVGNTTFIVPDQRGTGNSHKPETGYALSDYAADALSLMDGLGVERFTIVGHSMGGQTAQHIAAHYPARVRALALINPVPAGGVPLPDEVSTMFRGSGVSRAAQAGILDAATKQLDASVKEVLVADAANVSTACIEQAFDAWVAGGFSDALSNITAPTLVLATDDPFLSPEILREHVTSPIKSARQAYLTGPGHYPLAERPSETTAILEAFLTGIPD
ncbi:MAG: alpha/beta fold hydrolase [Polyangiales bacterium]